MIQVAFIQSNTEIAGSDMTERIGPATREEEALQ
jgi:hypothetical protein